MAKRSKSGKILVYVGADAVKRAKRNAELSKLEGDRAIRKAARKARTLQNSSMKEIGYRAAQIARRLARAQVVQARRLAKRREKAALRRENFIKNTRPKKPYHPRGGGATEKYTSYARRLERSKSLSATRVSATTFSCNGHLIRVTPGANPKAISCTCPDFTQVENGISWKGSNAGPFNPCKHMMAVKEIGWYEKLTWTYNYNATGGTTNVLLYLMSGNLPKTSVLSLGDNCSSGGGKTRLLNGSPYGNCMEDNIFNPLVSAEWTYWEGQYP